MALSIMSNFDTCQSSTCTKTKLYSAFHYLVRTRSVGSSDNEDLFSLFKSIEFSQQLIDNAFGDLILAALTTRNDRVQLVEENNARRRRARTTK